MLVDGLGFAVEMDYDLMLTKRKIDGGGDRY